MATIDINEVKSQGCADVEIYAYTDSRRRLLTDSIKSLDVSLSEVEGYDGDVFIMDEDEYNSTVLANSCTSADFAEWYGDANAKVCVIILYDGEED